MYAHIYYCSLLHEHDILILSLFKCIKIFLMTNNLERFPGGKNPEMFTSLYK